MYVTSRGTGPFLPAININGKLYVCKRSCNTEEAAKAIATNILHSIILEYEMTLATHAFDLVSDKA